MPADAPTLSALASRLAALQEAGAEQLAPVQMRHASALLTRLQTLRNSSPLVRQRLAAQLARLEQQPDPTTHGAKGGTASAQDPSRGTTPSASSATSTPTARTPAQHFAPLRARLTKRDSAHTAPLSGLAKAFHSQAQSLPALHDEGDSQHIQDNTSAPPPLNALQQAKRQHQRSRTRQRMARAILDAPSDAGPLNPHRQVSASLQQLKHLSPAYFERLMAHMDALMWLEKQRP